MATNSQDQQQGVGQTSLSDEGYRHAVALMHECCTEHGFLATPTQHHNYRRIWGRDSAIIGLAALLTVDSEDASSGFDAPSAYT